MRLHFCGGITAKCIGKTMMLAGDYDPDQLWLPFVDAVVVDRRPRPVQHGSYSQRRIADEAERKWAWTSEADRVLFFEERGVSQPCLPFWQGRNMTKADWARSVDAQHPAFDRDSEGRLLLLKIDASKKANVVLWCKTNCKGRFHFRKSYVAFERARDYVLAKMWFDGNS